MRLLSGVLASWLFIVMPTASNAAEPETSRRDWTLHPPVAELQTGEDVYAMGDVHGDYERMTELLFAAKLIQAIPAQPKNVRWSGGKNVLVVVGDFIDKYDRSLDVIDCLRCLQADAPGSGGRVIITMGNHEAEFLAAAGKKKKAVSITEKLLAADRKGKKAPTLAAELIAAGISPAQVAAGADAAGIGRFLRDLPIAARVNDWFFCHAGNTHGSSLPQLRDSLVKGIDADGYAGAILSDPDSLLEARMHPHPWWEIEAAGRQDASDRTLRKNIETLGCHHLVFGHQPGEATFADGTHRDRDEMFTKFDGLIFMIDTGMSRGADGGRGAVLKIHRDQHQSTATAIYADGKTVPLWAGHVPS